MIAASRLQQRGDFSPGDLFNKLQSSTFLSHVTLPSTRSPFGSEQALREQLQLAEQVQQRERANQQTQQQQQQSSQQRQQHQQREQRIIEAHLDFIRAGVHRNSSEERAAARQTWSKFYRDYPGDREAFCSRFRGDILISVSARYCKPGKHSGIIVMHLCNCKPMSESVKEQTRQKQSLHVNTAQSRLS